MIVAPTERRVLALLGGTLLLAAALRAGPRGWSAWQALGERVAARRALLSEVTTALAALPALEDSAAFLREGLVALGPRLLAGQGEAAALADLSARLTTLAPLHHARLLRLELVPGSARAGRLRRLTARAGVETDFAGLAELLDGLERQVLILVPEHVVITQPEAPGPPEVPERLVVEVELTGWYLAAEAP